MDSNLATIVRERLAAREKTIQSLQPQIVRSEQFANELRGKLFAAQAQRDELTDLLKCLEPDAKASPEISDANPPPASQ